MGLVGKGVSNYRTEEMRMKNRILRIVLLVAVLLAACGQDIEKDQEAV